MFKYFSTSRNILGINRNGKVLSSVKMILTFVILFIRCVESNGLNLVKLPSLYWSTNNRLFTDFGNNPDYYLKLNAHIGDSIDLVCPRSSLNDNSYEYSIIYKVSSKYEFDNCLINPENYETVPILKCDKANSINSVKFTIYFVKYSPVPNALEFEEDKEYYFLSTSSGMKDGLNHQAGGLCSKFNMKFSIKINSQTNQNSSLLQKLVQKNEDEDKTITQPRESLNKKTDQETSSSESAANNLPLQSISQLSSKLNLFAPSSSIKLNFNLNFILLSFLSSIFLKCFISV